MEVETTLVGSLHSSYKRGGNMDVDLALLAMLDSWQKFFLLHSSHRDRGSHFLLIVLVSDVVSLLVVILLLHQKGQGGLLGIMLPFCSQLWASSWGSSVNLLIAGASYLIQSHTEPLQNGNLISALNLSHLSCLWIAGLLFLSTRLSSQLQSVWREEAGLLFHQ